MERNLKPTTVERFLKHNGWYGGGDEWRHFDGSWVHTEDEALEEEAKRDGINGTLAAILLMLKD